MYQRNNRRSSRVGMNKRPPVVCALLALVILGGCTLPKAQLTGTYRVDPIENISKTTERKIGDLHLEPAVVDGQLLQLTLVGDAICEDYTVKHVQHRARHVYKVGKTDWGFHTPFDNVLRWVNRKSLGMQLLLYIPVTFPMASMSLAMLPVDLAANVVLWPIAAVRSVDRIRTVDHTEEKHLVGVRDCGVTPIARTPVELRAGHGEATSFFVVDSMSATTDRRGQAVFSLVEMQGFGGSSQTPRFELAFDRNGGDDAEDRRLAVELSDGELRDVIRSWREARE
jgi:hypothetical protein